MIKTINCKDVPELFREIGEYIIAEASCNHRRSSNFYVESIVQFSPTDEYLAKTVPNFERYHGTWKTNSYIRDTEYGTEWSEITTLTRVTKKTKLVEVTSWEPA